MRKDLAHILACPVCQAPLHLDESWPDPVNEGSLTCRGCLRVYAIHAGLPLLLLKDTSWIGTKAEIEGERELCDELPLCEHIKRNHFEAGRSLRLLDRLHLRRSPLVLDVGGSSGLGAYLFKRFGARVVIVDIVPHLLKVGEAGLSGRMDFDLAVASMEWLPFRANTFDVVFCRQALHHTPNPASVVRELFRVARMGGQVLIASEPCVPVHEILLGYLDRRPRAVASTRGAEILEKLPDQDFKHSWNEYEQWLEAVTDRYRIEPAGGSVGLVSTPNGLVYDPYATSMSRREAFINTLLFGRRGFRGDINVIGTKMNEVVRVSNPEGVDPVTPEDSDLRDFHAGEIALHRDLFPKMFPFPI